MKISTLILLMGISSIAYALPSVNYSKQEKVVEKIIDLIFENKAANLETVFASNENLNKDKLQVCVKEASGKIRSRGSKHLYASRVTSHPDNGDQTLYEIAFFYYFAGKKVFYYKLNIVFDHEQSMYKPVDMEFIPMKELSLLDIDATSLVAVSPIARN